MRVVLSLSMAVFVGCADPATGGAGEKDGEVDDTATGGGSGAEWHPAGSGVAFFADGEKDNSLLRLQMSRCIPPREGEAYHGWISIDGADPLPVGEIDVRSDSLDFSGEVGINAVIAGYNRFEAWASDDGSEPAGELLWTGSVDGTVYGVLRRLLIESPDTPDGQGSLRTVESEIEAIAAYAQAAIDASGSLEELKSEAEIIANTIEEDDGRDTIDPDYDGDGTVETMEGLLPIYSDDGDAALTTLIDADFLEAAEALTALDPTSPILDYIDDGYDGLDVIELWAHEAHVLARTATAAGAADAIELKLSGVIDDLGYALDGADADGNGTVELLTEGGLERAIYWTSYLAYMEVSTP